MWTLRGADGSIATGWYLLPLRLFLGVTFVYAGLQKLANPDFFKDSSPVSIHAQLVGAAHTSPIGSLLGHLTGAASVIGAAIAVAEVAIGVGALLGLLTRVAAVGGMLVSLSLFLAISFHSRPYFTGSDIVFLVAWTPFVLAGAAGAPALDTWLAGRPAPFGTATDASGEGAVSRGAVIGIVAAGSAVLIGAVAGLGRVFAPSTGTSNAGGTTTTTTPPTTTTVASSTSTAAGAPTTTTAPLPKGTSIGSASQVPVGGSAAFTDPKSGDPSLVIQQTTDVYKAFDAICPHAGCTVAYQASASVIACPCHGSEFNPKTGAVIQGPATSGLTPIKVIKGSNGDLYVVS
jgi:thiosulfate dehydrogenase [quinone] large subunit